MKTKLFTMVIALGMAGYAFAAKESASVKPGNVMYEFRAPNNPSGFEFVKNVTIYKALGPTSRDGQTATAQKTASVYIKDGEYYIKVPDLKQPVKVGDNYMYGRTDLDGVWNVDLQYHACGWYFNL
ncbi:MAG: hypothetical protein NC396_07655 [Bacteroides sp.]|nr:hypothetical protein [Bacteroides sp.]MCM1086170.1 hypothetical protein [Bacteroides sp.]